MYKISPNITTKININDAPIVSADELGKWLNLSSSAIIAKQSELESLVQTATEIIEDYAWLTLRQTTYEADFYLNDYTFDGLLNCSARLSLERSPILDLNNITKIEYLLNDTWVEFDRGAVSIDGLYENTTEKKEQREWATIYFRESVDYQSRNNAYKIRVTFIAGWDPTATTLVDKIPEKLRTAIKIIAAFHYTYRGDCAAKTSCDMNGYPVPCHAKAMVDQLAISNTVIGGEYNPISYHPYSLGDNNG